MDVTPTTPKPRPTRAKSNAAKTTASPGKVATKPGAGHKVTAAASEIVEAHLVEMTSSGSADISTDIDQRIATTAYFMAAARNFEPGHELEDWLEAERRVRGVN